MKKFLIIIFFSTLLVGVGAFIYSKDALKQKQESDELNIKTITQNFGQKLKNVSLLSPTASQEIENNYKEFLTQELLNEWKNTPPDGLGRLTSSPWPDRIEIKSVKKISSKKYIIQGEVIEADNSEKITQIKTWRNIIIDFTKENNKWLISNVLMSSYMGREVLSSNFSSYNIEHAISRFLLSKKEFNNKIKGNSQNFCVVENLDPNIQLFPFYIWAYCSEYGIKNNKLENFGGISIPLKVNYPNELSYYSSDKFSYEKPRDGSYYLEDIKKIFPENLHDKIINFSSRNDIKNIIQRAEIIAFDNISSWELIKKSIENCQVKQIFQAHDLSVSAKLKNGEEIKAMEPSIDEIIDIAVNNESKCGRIIMATE